MASGGRRAWTRLSSDLVQTAKNGELSLEWVLPEEELEDSVLVVAPSLPVAVGHGNLADCTTKDGSQNCERGRQELDGTRGLA